MMYKKRLALKVLMFSLVLTNIPVYSFANETNIQQNKYSQELSNIETKENLQKSVQKAMESGEVDTWITGLANMPTTRSNLASAVVNSKIYCIGGYDAYDYLNTVEVYDPETDTWETKASMPTSRSNFASEVIDGKIYSIGGYNSRYLNTVEAYVAEMLPTEEEIAEEAVEKAEQSKDPTDIDNARDLVNQLPDSPKKDELNDRLDALLPPTPQEISANVDAYIKMKNTLCLSLDTNLIIFEGFSGVEDMEKLNAVNLTVESSLPYEVNAFLETEIQNTDKTETLDKSILGIRANGDVDYKSFNAINTPLNLSKISRIPTAQRSSWGMNAKTYGITQF